MKFKKYLAVVFAVAMSCAALAQSGRSLVTEMLEASIKGEEPKALELKAQIESLEKPERGDRKTARLLNETALKQLAASNYSEAITSLEQAQNADGSDVEVLNNLGFALMKSNLHERAIVVFQQAILSAPSRSAAWFNYGQSLAAIGKPDQAAGALGLAFHFSLNREKTKEVLSKLASNTDSVVLAAAATKALQNEGIKPILGSASSEPIPSISEAKPAEPSNSAAPEQKPAAEGRENSNITPSVEQKSQPLQQEPSASNNSTKDKDVYAFAFLILLALSALNALIFSKKIVVFANMPDFVMTSVFGFGVGLLALYSSNTMLIIGAIAVYMAACILVSFFVNGKNIGYAFIGAFSRCFFGAVAGALVWTTLRSKTQQSMDMGRGVRSARAEGKSQRSEYIEQSNHIRREEKARGWIDSLIIRPLLLNKTRVEEAKGI